MKKPVEIRPEDYAEWDSDIAVCAGGELFSDLADLMHHNYAAGDGWTPFADENDIPAVISEVRGHIERIEAATKKARADLAGVERNARLTAMRRQRKERKEAEESR